MISAALNLSTADMNGLLRIGDLLLLASVYPLIAVTVKRLHDFNKSGFYAVFFFLSPVFGLVSGDSVSNKYGAECKVVFSAKSS
jgi:uncharacterized membrane protein YhaH (DUF805 family)